MACFDKYAEDRKAQYIGLSADKSQHVFETIQTVGCAAQVFTVPASTGLDSRLKGKNGRIFEIDGEGRVKA